MQMPKDIYMHKVCMWAKASNLCLWGDLSQKLKQKSLFEFLNKVQRDISNKCYCECTNKKLLFLSSFFVIGMNFTTGGRYAEVEKSQYIALSAGTIVFHYK